MSLREWLMAVRLMSRWGVFADCTRAVDVAGSAVASVVGEY